MGVACGVSDGNSSAKWRLITMGGHDEAHDFMDELGPNSRMFDQRGAAQSRTAAVIVTWALKAAAGK